MEPARTGIGLALAEAADRPTTWPGLGSRDPSALRLFVVDGAEAFQASAPGQVPPWGAGLALPGIRTLVVRVDAVGNPFQTLRHELAHLAVREAIRVRLPLWFDEGYAVVAASELGRIRALELNLALAGGRVPTLRELDRELRAGPVSASQAYALAGTAVQHLARRHPDGTLDALMSRLESGAAFSDAVLASTGLTLGQFELAWQRDTKRRYGLLVWLVAGGGWLIAGMLLALGVMLRRRRDRPRRLALDVGWELPAPELEEEDAALDQRGESR
ncbi:MAG: peptidase MA family metallohydrolase [Gemmatimonadota bacterium]|nr:peptidase MA family metallohydrolase [Gemmatimonadota bacterium]